VALTSFGRLRYSLNRLSVTITSTSGTITVFLGTGGLLGSSQGVCINNYTVIPKFYYQLMHKELL